MEKSKIEQIIFDAIEITNNARNEDDQIPITKETMLYGTEGYLDSMGLVGFLIEIEESLMDLDYQVSLSDERAMSQTKSPFRNVETLTDYIDLLLKE